MIEALFLASVYVVGLGVVLARPGVGGAGAAVLALPIGFAAYVLSAVALLALGFAHSSALAVAVAAVAVVALRARAGVRATSLTSRPLSAAGVGLGSVVVGSLVLQDANLVRVTDGSFHYIQIGSNLAQGFSVSETAPLRWIEKRAILVVLHHAGASDLYRPSITPLLGLAGAASFVWLSVTCLRELGVATRWVWGLTVAGAIAVVATSRFAYHLFYLNGHLTFGVLILIFMAVTWLGMVRRDEGLVVLAALPLAAGVLARAEAPLLLGFFLVPVLTSTAISRGVRWVMAAAFSGPAIVWYGLTIGREFGLTAGRNVVVGPVAIAGLLVVFLALLEHSPLRRWRSSIPGLAVGAGVLALVAMTLHRPELIVDSAVATWRNQESGTGDWGLSWLVLVPLVGAGLLVGRLPARSLWSTSMLGVPLLYLAIPYVRDGVYRVSTQDSANRMLMHVFLVAVFFVVLSIGSLVVGRWRQQGRDRGGSAATRAP